MLNKLYTVMEFEQFIAQPENADKRLELVYGEIVEKPMPTREHGIVAGNFVTDINLYLRQNPIGYAAVEARHRPPDDDENDRLPDVSFVSNMNKPVERKGAALYMPDLAIEIKSPDDSYLKMVERALFYLKHGSRMVWLAYPEKRQIEVWTLDDHFTLNENDYLEGGDVLPGFRVMVKSFFV